MTQNEKVLKHMQDHGSITPLDAMRDYRIMRLASRVSDLKHLGYDIRTEMIEVTNKDGDRVRYARYSLR